MAHTAPVNQVNRGPAKEQTHGNAGYFPKWFMPGHINFTWHFSTVTKAWQHTTGHSEYQRHHEKLGIYNMYQAPLLVSMECKTIVKCWNKLLLKLSVCFAPSTHGCFVPFLLCLWKVISLSAYLHIFGVIGRWTPWECVSTIFILTWKHCLYIFYQPGYKFK